MGTRGVLRVHGKYGGPVTIYIHSDMYPSGLAFLLYAFRKAYPDFDASRRGVDYWAASFVWFIKTLWITFLRMLLRTFKNMYKGISDFNAIWWLEVGIAQEGVVYGDIEYEYDLFLGSQRIAVRELWERKAYSMELDEFLDKYLPEEDRKLADTLIEAMELLLGFL